VSSGVMLLLVVVVVLMLVVVALWQVPGRLHWRRAAAPSTATASSLVVFPVQSTATAEHRSRQ